MLESIVVPTAPTTKAGPEFIQNHTIRFACEAERELFSYNWEIIFAPTGNPPTRLINIAHAEQPGSLKTFSVRGDKNLPAALPRLERTMKSERIIKGNSDGITVSPQRKSPFRTPSPIKDGSKKKSIIKPIEAVSEKISFL